MFNACISYTFLNVYINIFHQICEFLTIISPNIFSSLPPLSLSLSLSLSVFLF